MAIRSVRHRLLLVRLVMNASTLPRILAEGRAHRVCADGQGPARGTWLTVARHWSLVPSQQSLPVVASIAPILAKPFHRPGWVYEEEYDGWRIIGYKQGRRWLSAARLSRIDPPGLVLVTGGHGAERTYRNTSELPEVRRPWREPVCRLWDSMALLVRDLRGLWISRRGSSRRSWATINPGRTGRSTPPLPAQ